MMNAKRRKVRCTQKNLHYILNYDVFFNNMIEKITIPVSPKPQRAGKIPENHHLFCDNIKSNCQLQLPNQTFSQ